jgi:hypothetical protein
MRAQAADLGVIGSDDEDVVDREPLALPLAVDVPAVGQQVLELAGDDSGLLDRPAAVVGALDADHAQAGTAQP